MHALDSIFVDGRLLSLCVYKNVMADRASCFVQARQFEGMVVGTHTVTSLV